MLKKDFLLENSIYSEEYINSAITDFEDFTISYKKWKLTIEWDTPEEIDEIFGEFMNYVISLHNETF